MTFPFDLLIFPSFIIQWLFSLIGDYNNTDCLTKYPVDQDVSHSLQLWFSEVLKDFGFVHSIAQSIAIGKVSFRLFPRSAPYVRLSPHTALHQTYAWLGAVPPSLIIMTSPVPCPCSHRCKLCCHKPPHQKCTFSSSSAFPVPVFLSVHIPLGAFFEPAGLVLLHFIMSVLLCSTCIALCYLRISAHRFYRLFPSKVRQSQ